MSAQARGPIALPPPVIYLAGLLIGLLLENAWPGSLLPERWGNLLGAVLVIVGAALAATAFVRFRRAGTPFDVRKPASALVTDGPYRRSRNPGYVALTIFYVGIACLLNSPWVLVMVVPVFLVVDVSVVRREERHLQQMFGNDYVQYRKSVRRWI